MFEPMALRFINYRRLSAARLYAATLVVLGGCQMVSGFIPGAAPRTPQIVRGTGPMLQPAAMPRYVVGETFAFDDGRQDTVLEVQGPRVTWGRGTESKVTVSHGFTIPATTWQTRTRRSRAVITTRLDNLWPLMVGKIQHFQISQVIERRDGRTFGDGSMRQEFQQNWTCAVELTVRVKVKAGDFDTYRIGCYRYSPENGEWRQTRLTYYAPSVGNFVLREDHFTSRASRRVELLFDGFNSTVLPEADQVSLNRTLQEVLNRNADGQETRWRSAIGTLQVALVPVRSYSGETGVTCREYTSTYFLGSRVRKNNRRVCPQANGHWRRVR